MGILRADNITGVGGKNAMKGSVAFSGYVDASSADWLQVHDNLDDFDMGTGDFTFECWVKAADHDNGYAGIFGMYNYDTAGILLQIHDDGRMRITNPGTIDISGSDSNAIIWGPGQSMGDWHHYAVARSGSTLKAFLNGVEQISTSYSNAIDFSTGGSAVIGITDRSDYPGDYDLRGFISNLRLIKGTALYTTAFTPPTEELKPIDGTVLLCCQDSDNPTQEATGRHEIVGFRKCYYGKRYSNIATNGDLETGTTTGWTNNGCGTFEVSNNSHSGSYSLHCVSNSNGDGVSYAVTLNTTLRYKISAYVKCVGPLGTSAKTKMKIGNGFGGNENYESQTVGYDSYKPFDRWEYLEWIGLASYGTTTISFVESSSNAVNDWYVDDLRVELWYPEEGENILANPNFLTGATGWSFTSGNANDGSGNPVNEWSISSNRLNVTDTNRTNDAYATQQLFTTAIAEGMYQVQIDYVLTAADFDIGIGNNRIFGVSGGGSIPPGAGNSASVTYIIEAGVSNTSLRLIGNQYCAGYFNNITLSRVPEPKRVNPVPTVGVDDGVTLADNTKFDTQSYMVVPKGDTTQRNRGRGVIVAGENPAKNKSISYIEMQSGGIARDFGDLTKDTGECKGVASSTRGVFHLAGDNPATRTHLDYVTIATTSNALDFGDLNAGWWMRGACSNETRGLFAGGLYPGSAQKDDVDYITIPTKGNALDFGNLADANNAPGGLASPTRALMAGGGTQTQIDYREIASLGTFGDFGDLTVGGKEIAAVASNTRGIFGPRKGDPAIVNTIDYVTIATLGAAVDFGDGVTVRAGAASLSNSIRGAWAGGYTPSKVNTIEYVNIATIGNSFDFGEITYVNQYGGGASDSHGGIS